MHTVMLKPSLFALNVPSYEIHKPQAHSMYTSLLCCNLDILQQTHKIKCPSNLLRGIHDHLFIYSTIFIDSISINFYWSISILLGQFNSIETSLKHTNKPFNTKKTLPITTFFPDTHNGFAVIHINIMVDVSSHLQNSRLP